jgi:hypothetical protein
MNLNSISEDVVYNSEYSIEDWNELIHTIFYEYFENIKTITANKEILRIEIINYSILQKNGFIGLMNNTFYYYDNIICKGDVFEYLKDTFDEQSKIDYYWMTLCNTQKHISELYEVDKIDYLFQEINSVLEKAFQPRLRHLYNFILINKKKSIDENVSFGSMVDTFPREFELCENYLYDPIFNIKISQWRNIAEHKSYYINQNNILLSYGTGLKNKTTIEFKELDETFNWIKNVYYALRLAQTLIYIKYIPKLKKEYNLKCGNDVRFDSLMTIYLQNMADVGFKYVNSTIIGKKITYDFLQNTNEDIQKSIIHCSQTFGHIAFSLENDPFMKGKINTICIRNISTDNNQVLAMAEVEMKDVSNFIKKKMSLDDYIKLIYFKIGDIVISKKPLTKSST